VWLVGRMYLEQAHESHKLREGRSLAGCKD